MSLGKARKSRARDTKRARADENAAKFGRSKAEKDLEKARALKSRVDLDGHKRET